MTYLFPFLEYMKSNVLREVAKNIRNNPETKSWVTKRKQPPHCRGNKVTTL
jgi:hypothetical protein